MCFFLNIQPYTRSFLEAFSIFFFFFSSRRRHTRSLCDWSSDVCSSDLPERLAELRQQVDGLGGVAARVFAVAGDLEQEDLGLSLADREVLRQAKVVFHLGAHFAWGLSMEHARAVNVEGARRVAQLAAEQESRLVMIGGYMLKN